MSDIITITATCQKCGDGLTCTADAIRGEVIVSVTPCEHCLEAAADKARDEGRREAEE